MNPAPARRKSPRILAASVATLLGFLSGLPRANADQFWDGPNLNNAATEGGTGIWNAKATNWTDAGGALNSIYDPSQVARFGVAAGTVTLGDNLSFTTLRFDVSGYTIEGAGFNLTPTGTAILNAQPGMTATINAQLTGMGAISVEGGGTIKLANFGNDYMGGTTLVGGTLLAESFGALGSGTLTITATGGAATLGSTVNGTILFNPVSVKGNFSVTSSSAGAHDFSLLGSVDLNGATREVTGTTLSGQMHFGNTISNGALTLKTPFTTTGDYVAFILDPTNANTYSGLTTVGSGAFLVFEGTATNGAIQGDVLVTGNGVLDYLAGSAHQIADTATVTVNSTGNNASTSVFQGLEFFGNSGDTIGTLNGNGTVGLGAGTLTVGAGNFTGVIMPGALGSTGGGLTKYGPGTLTLSGANTYTGATTVNGGKLVLDTTTVATVLGITSKLVVGGGTFQLLGNAGTQTQKVAGLTVNAGASVLDARNLGTTTTINLGTGNIVRNVGGTVDFTASAGIFGTDAIIKTTQANDATGIIGAWATVNGGADFARNDGADKIVAFTGYTNLNALGSTIADGSGTHVRINNAGAGGNVALGAATTNIGTLSQDFGTASTIDTAGKTLRLGTIGGVFITPTGADLTIGTAVGLGTITAGGNAANVAGELILGNFSSTSTLAINSVIADNGSGVVGLTTTGAGVVTLNAVNTYTGVTNVGGGTLNLNATTGLNAVAGNVAIHGGNLVLLKSEQIANTSSVTVSSGSLNLGANVETVATVHLTGGAIIGTTGVLTSADAYDIQAGSISAILGGTAGLTKSSAGTATLSGANSYVGATKILDGVLKAGAANTIPTGSNVLVQPNSTLDLNNFDQSVGSIANGSGGGGVINLGTAILSTGSDNTDTGFSGFINGTGGLTKTGTGTFLLAGTNNYSGPTGVDGGVLILSSLLRSPVTVDNGSKFDVTASGSVNQLTAPGAVTLKGTGDTFNNAGAIVGGAAGVVEKGTGSTVTNSAAGTITGTKAIDLTGVTAAGNNVIINYGTLTGKGGTAIDATGSLASVKLTNVNVINGAVVLSPLNDVLTVATGTTLTGTANGNGGTDALRLVGGGDDTADLGKFTNFSTVTKVGGGTWTAIGTGTFPGGTTISAGEILVEGNLVSNVLVTSAGTLGGHGLITGNLINAGTVSIGGAFGTLSVKGKFSQQSGGTLVIRINGSAVGQHDALAVQGQAELGGNLELKKGSGVPRLKPGERVTFLTATEGVNGRFSNVTNPFSHDTMVSGEVVYGADSVVLEGVQASYVELGNFFQLSPNQLHVGGMLDSAANDPRARNLMQYLNKQPIDQIPGLLNQISPEAVASVFRLGNAAANVQAQNIQRRAADVRSGASGFSATGFQAAGSGPGVSGGFGLAGATGPEGKSGERIAPPPDKRWGTFVTGVGEFVHVGDTDNARGYDVTSGGFTMGVDCKLTPNFAVGLSAGYASTSANLANDGRVSVNGADLGVYATYFTGGFYVDAAASGGFKNYGTQRSALQGDARGRTDGEEVDLLFGTGYFWKKRGLSFGPTATFQYTDVGLNGFTEKGSLAPLEFGSLSAESIRTTLGLKVSYDWKLGDTIVRPELSAAWKHEYGPRSFAIDSRLASGAGSLFTVNDGEIGRDSLLLSGGVAVLWSPRTSTYLYYDGELGRKEYDSQNVSGGVRVSF